MHYAKSGASDVQSANQSCCRSCRYWYCRDWNIMTVPLLRVFPHRFSTGSSLCSMQQQGWWYTEDGITAVLLHCCRTCTGWVPRSVLNSDWPYSSSAVAVTPCRRTWQDPCTGPLTTTPDGVGDRQPPTSWSCYVHDAAPSTTEHVVAAARVQNDLPLAVRSATSLNTFKNLKTHLFQSSYSRWHFVLTV